MPTSFSKCASKSQLKYCHVTISWNLVNGNDNGNYLPHGLGFRCSHRGSNLIFHAHCLLSKKLVAALIVTGEGGAETIANNNSKTI